jgi:hypothetical protein
MFEENLSLSQQYQKVKLQEKANLSEAFIFLKSKKENNSETINTSFDITDKPVNIFNNNFEKLKENGNKIIKLKNIEKKIGKKLLKKPFGKYFENTNLNKIIFSKKRLLEQILNDKKIEWNKEKIRTNSLNIKAIKLNKILNKTNLLVNVPSTSELDINKIKNDINDINNDKTKNTKNGNYNNKTINPEKLEQINMNKTALFKKLKFESLKKFCKNVKLTEKKIGFNFIAGKRLNPRNEIRKNNCEEIKINCIKEKVRQYFIGKFNNIKEYFDSWDERKIGKIFVNDIYNYVNKKIKYKISKNEIRKLLFSISNKNYLDLENFRIIFFEDSPNEKLFIKGNKFIELNEATIKNINDISYLNKSESSNNISFFEKFRYNEMISLILQQKNFILSQITKDRIDLTFVEFYSIIRNIVKEKKLNFDKQIKKLFNEYKDENSELINIYNFFEKIHIKNEGNKKNNSVINIKKQITMGFKPIFNKNKSSLIILNSRNPKNSLNFKESNKCQTNFIYGKVINKEIENNQKNNIISLNKLRNININFSKEKDKKNSSKLKFFLSNVKKEQDIEECLKSDNDANASFEKSENTKIIDIQLPNIITNERNKNKNSDIIAFL